MPSLQLYKLHPKGAFHFGTHGIEAEESAERCPSDTLYAALLSESLWGGPTFFAPPNGHDDRQPLDPPLLLSSCFPYVDDLLLLPRPQLPLRISKGKLDDQPKLAKKLKYVSPTIFGLILGQQEGALDAYLPGAGGTIVMEGKVWVANQDGDNLPKEPFWKVETVPHVTVDRLREASNYFQVGQVHFREGCGLYLLYNERVEGAGAGLGEQLQRLGDSGLGGRRSYGLGQFDVSGPLPVLESLNDRSDPQRLALLSRYRPAPAELDAGVLGAGASYELVQVGGWLQTNHSNTRSQRRRSVRLLSEGSVVQMPHGNTPIGTVCDVRPEYTSDVSPFPHPVWRYGLALGIGIGAAQ